MAWQAAFVDKVAGAQDGRVPGELRYASFEAVSELWGSCVGSTTLGTAASAGHGSSSQAREPRRPSVLIHCVHGTSRSATVMCAVLLYRRLVNGRSFESTACSFDGFASSWFCAGVLQIVQLARPEADPNAGFLRQLADFHRELEIEDHGTIMTSVSNTES
jgi:hypothetical protein